MLYKVRDSEPQVPPLRLYGLCVTDLFSAYEQVFSTSSIVYKQTDFRPYL